jgi:hypothetical protein
MFLFFDEKFYKICPRCRLPNARNVATVADWNVNAYNGNEIDVEDLGPILQSSISTENFLDKFCSNLQP